MYNELASLILRKFVVTFVATTISSLSLSFLNISGSLEIIYDQGDYFIGWFLIFFMYMGIIILIYGNAVAVVIEYLQRKWFTQHDWLYVLILGLFGLGNGILFQEKWFAIAGMLTALLYAIIDKWFYKRQTESKSLKMFFLLPILTLLLVWGYFHVISPPTPPFTKEDAIAYATSGEGTVIEHFPKEIGIWEGTVAGYQVTRESSAEKIGDEIYLVTFTERWSQGTGEGFYTVSYKIDRQSLTARGEEGKLPPYYEGN